MQWQTLLVFASALSVASAQPSTETTKQFQNTIHQDSTLKDPLWKKYCLNVSAEYKYFHEPGNDDILGHYDERFFSEPVSDSERAETLTHLIQAYLNFFDENGLETWIAHGTLLGWWWNGKVRSS